MFEKAQQINIHRQVSSSTLFKVIPVKLFGNNNKTVSTFEFLDEGSSVTLLDNSIANELQLFGQIQPLCLKWTNNQTVTDFEPINVSVSIGSDSDVRKRFTLSSVRTIKDLKLPQQ